MILAVFGELLHFVILFRLSVLSTPLCYFISFVHLVYPPFSSVVDIECVYVPRLDSAR